VPEKPHNSEWAPHIWEGACFSAWVRLLATNRFAVHFRYWWVAAIATVVTFMHSVFWLIEQIFWRHRFQKTPRPDDPIFILGHWRTGTTLLHELMIRDHRHCYPNTYQCMEPNHFHIAEAFVTRFMPFLLPKRRPMDDMPTGWDRPQEDEFALCMMGQPSPYTHIGFPNNPPVDLDALDFRGFTEQQKAKWAAALADFLRRVAVLHPGKRLVLKSPPHSARIAVLVKRFPNARFIHIVRNPYVVFPSTLRLWSALYRNHTLQVPDHSQLENFVVQCGQRLYGALERDSHLIPAQRFHELRYEDLIANPVLEMEKLYRKLELGAFAEVRPMIESYFAGHRDYKPNRHEVTPEIRAKVNQHWSEIVQRFGYADRQETAPIVHRRDGEGAEKNRGDLRELVASAKSA
jgi:hypothetical protein